MKYLICFLLAYSTIGCFKTNNEFCTQTLLFDIPLEITPQVDTFHIGDTIWLTSTVNHLIEDRNLGDTVDISSFDFQTRVGIYKFVANANAFDYVEYINQVGEFQLFTRHIKMRYNFGENQRNIKIGLVPIKTGGLY